MNTEDLATREADQEIAALRAEMLAAGLLPDLPCNAEPTAASAEAMLQRVLLANVSVVDPVMSLRDPQDDDNGNSVILREDAEGDEVAESILDPARLRRRKVTQALFGLAATVLVGAVVVLPLIGGITGDDQGLTAIEGAASDLPATRDGGLAVPDSVDAVAPLSEPETAMDDSVAESADEDQAVTGVIGRGPELQAHQTFTISGPLSVLAGECLVVLDDATGVPYVVLPQPGAALPANVEPGDALTLTGHRATAADLAAVTLPAACPADSVVWLYESAEASQ